MDPISISAIISGIAALVVAVLSHIKHFRSSCCCVGEVEVDTSENVPIAK